MATVGQRDLTLLRRLLRQARPCWTHIGGLFALGLLATPIALLTPFPLKLAVDSVIGSEPPPRVLDALLPRAAVDSDRALLAVTAVLLVAVALLRQLQELASSILRAHVRERLVLSFRASLFGHVQRISVSYHDARGTADSAYRIQHDAPAVQYVAVESAVPMLTASVTFGAMIYVTGRISVELALVALAVSPVLFFLSWAYRRRLRKGWSRAKRLDSEALGVVQEALSSLRVVKIFGQEERERERFVRHSRAGMRTRVRLAVMEGGFALLAGLVTAAGAAAVLVIGVGQVQSGALTLGNLLLVMGYLAQLYEPLQTIGRKAASLQAHLASAERAFAILDEAPDVPEPARPRPLGRAEGAVCFRRVSFSYGDRPVLRDVSFEIPPGAHLGIEGATGAGKTTLVSLLMRFFDPTSGEIFLDGVDLRRYALSDVRRQFAIVLQESVLFSASIAENITYARPDARYDEIVAAAKAAGAHGFISSLPDGYVTQVGERGMQLSGGERQRIALARAFLKDAPILILDEPTSAVDAATEAAILDAMERLSRGRTTLTIAHRQGVLARSNVHLRIEDGRLVRAGTGHGDRVGKFVAGRADG